MGEMIYSPYDITGAKFLWWTWHDTDAPVRDRLFGAVFNFTYFFSTEAKRKTIYFFFQPIGSSTWVITFCCSFHFIWRKILSEDQISNGTNLSIMQALSKLLISAAFSTPLMMLQMAFFQLISGDPQGLPTARTMLACIAVYLILIRFWPL